MFSGGIETIVFVEHIPYYRFYGYKVLFDSRKGDRAGGKRKIFVAPRCNISTMHFYNQLDPLSIYHTDLHSIYPSVKWIAK